MEFSTKHFLENRQTLSINRQTAKCHLMLEKQTAHVVYRIHPHFD